MILRLLAVVTLLLAGGGCAGVPAAVVWTTVGSGLGFGAAALRLDDDLFRYFTAEKPTQPKIMPGLETR